jgi:citronellol/citronellal dehydrogenase
VNPVIRPFFAPGLFRGQVALVTGGGTGIGLCVARELCNLGARVAITSRKPEHYEAARDALTAEGFEVHATGCDIRHDDQVDRMVDQVLERFGRIDVLINNAGGQFPSPVRAMTPRGWEAVIRNNLNGTFNVTLAVANKAMLVARRGRIVNVTASVGRGFPGMAHTGAARAAVENLTRSLSIEWASEGIRINAVAPGNNIQSSGTEQYGAELIELARKASPLKRLGTPEEVARVIVFLASDANDFITGSVYSVDGGQALWGDMWPIEDRAAPTAQGEAVPRRDSKST